MKTVLIVGDSASLRLALRITLTGAGYEVIEAANGQEALQKLSVKHVHLIITDINMPNLDGIEFVRELKRQPAHRFTPVIMLTVESEQEQIKLGRDAGARAWIVKPFHPRQILLAATKLVAI